MGSQDQPNLLLMKTTNPNQARLRFIQNLAESELFQQYQKAFHTLTALPLTLEMQPDGMAIQEAVTRESSRPSCP